VSAGRASGSPSESSKDLAFSLAILFVAIVPRLYVAIAWSKEPVWDGHYYHFGAERIASGLGYSEDVWVDGRLVWKPWVHYPVGYSALLALGYRVFGSSLLVAPVLNALAGALLAFLAHRVARQYLSETRARIGAALVALHPGLIAYSALVMTEVVATALLFAAGLALLVSRERGRRWLVVAGFLLGLGALVRPTSLFVLPLVIGMLPGPFGRRLLGAVIVVVASLATIAPWTLRNCRRLDGCALISTNGGWNLAIGAVTESGRFQTLRAEDGCRVVTGQVQQDRCWARVGWQKIRAAPARFFAVIPKKLGETFNHESFAIEYLHEADPVSWNESRRVAGRELSSTFHRLLLAFATFGVIAWPPRYGRDRRAFIVQALLLAFSIALSARALADAQHQFQWLALFIAGVGLLPLPGRPPLGAAGLFVVGSLVVVVLTHALFFGEDRYHLVVSPVLCLLAAAALRAPAQPTRKSPKRSAAMTASVLEETPSLS